MLHLKKVSSIILCVSVLVGAASCVKVKKENNVPDTASTETEAILASSPSPETEEGASIAPIVSPTEASAKEPTASPTAAPTAAPTASPTAEPMKDITAAPTKAPTAAPTLESTKAPTEEPIVDETTEEPPGSPETTHDPDHGTDGIPAQPIRFGSADEAIAFLKSPDFSEYPEHQLEAYNYMIEEFKADSCVYQVKQTDKIRYLDGWGLTLYPQVKYEDSGCMNWVSYGEQEYQVAVYQTRDTEAAEAEGMLEYYNLRFNTSATMKECAVDNESVLVQNTSSGYVLLYRKLDEGHYIKIKTKAAETELLEFFGVLEVEKVDF